MFQHALHGIEAAIDLLDRALVSVMDHRHASRALKKLICSACVQRAHFRIVAMIDPKYSDARYSGTWSHSSRLHPRMLQYDAALILYFSYRPPPDYFVILGVGCFFRGCDAEAVALIAFALYSAPQRRWVFATGIPLAQKLLEQSRHQEPALQGRWQLLESNGRFRV